MLRSIRRALAPSARLVPVLSVCLALLLAPRARADEVDVTTLPTPYAPAWALVPPQKVLSLTFDPSKTNKQNGDLLMQKVESLKPGERLEVGDGVWSIVPLWGIDLIGTPTAPIWVVAAPGTKPVIKRPDTHTTVINIGLGGKSRFFALQGFEIEAGANGVKLLDCRDIWIDSNTIHDCNGVGVSSNSHDNQRIHITRNEIYHTGNTGEGMYLGANHGAHIFSEGVIAQNYVHDTGGWQADGIELKQGSWGNLIADNVVHSTFYPCILVYGTDGMPRNIVERNVMYDAVDHVLQVQGEAIVRNNLMMNGKHGFHSHDHQGQTRDLEFVNNTIINDKTGAYMTSWNNRPGMVFANNAVYSLAEAVIWNGGGANGVTRVGNVRFGPVYGANQDQGFVEGQGLSDFVDVSWDSTKRDAVPAIGSVLRNAATTTWAPLDDLHARQRNATPETGALQSKSWGRHYAQGLAGYAGKTPKISLGSSPELGNASFSVRLDQAHPNRDAFLLVGSKAIEVPMAGGYLLNSAQAFFYAPTDASGSAVKAAPLTNDPSLDGLAIYAQWAILGDLFAPLDIAQSDGLAFRLRTP